MESLLADRVGVHVGQVVVFALGLVPFEGDEHNNHSDEHKHCDGKSNQDPHDGSIFFLLGGWHNSWS